MGCVHCGETLDDPAPSTGPVVPEVKLPKSWSAVEPNNPLLDSVRSQHTPKLDARGSARQMPPGALQSVLGPEPSQHNASAPASETTSASPSPDSRLEHDKALLIQSHWRGAHARAQCDALRGQQQQESAARERAIVSSGQESGEKLAGVSLLLQQAGPGLAALGACQRVSPSGASPASSSPAADALVSLPKAGLQTLLAATQKEGIPKEKMYGLHVLCPVMVGAVAECPPPPGVWSCSVCFYDNAPSAKCCSLCGAPRVGAAEGMRWGGKRGAAPSDAPPESDAAVAAAAPLLGIGHLLHTGQASPRVEGMAAMPATAGPAATAGTVATAGPVWPWSCNVCFYDNYVSEWECSLCGLPRGAGAGYWEVQAAAAAEAAPPTWPCGVCYYDNPMASKECRQCGLPCDDTAAARIQAIQRGRRDRQRVNALRRGARKGLPTLYAAYSTRTPTAKAAMYGLHVLALALALLPGTAPATVAVERGSPKGLPTLYAACDTRTPTAQAEMYGLHVLAPALARGGVGLLLQTGARQSLRLEGLRILQAAPARSRGAPPGGGGPGLARDAVAPPVAYPYLQACADASAPGGLQTLGAVLLQLSAPTARCTRDFDAAAAKIQALQRGRKDRGRVAAMAASGAAAGPPGPYAALSLLERTAAVQQLELRGLPALQAAPRPRAGGGVAAPGPAPEPAGLVALDALEQTAGRMGVTLGGLQALQAVPRTRTPVRCAAPDVVGCDAGPGPTKETATHESSEKEPPQPGRSSSFLVRLGSFFTGGM